MRKTMTPPARLLTASLVLVALGNPTQGEEFPKGKLDNWHQWRGPLATGEAPGGAPPLKWDAKTNIRWKTPLPGRGSASPIIWGNKVFVLTAVDTGKQAKKEDIPKQRPGFRKIPAAPTTYHRFLVLCLDRNTGKVLWQKQANQVVPHEGLHRSHTFAASSPTTDGRYLYASFGSFGVYCYDLDGDLKWKRNLGRMETRRGWGEGVSPVIHGDSLIVNWDHEGQSYLFVLNARTGETRWKKERDEISSWATPLVVEHKGTTQLIVSGTGRVRSYDLATGKVLWECGGQTVNAIPSPVAQDGVVVCMSGYRGSAAIAIPLDARGDITGKGKIRWKYDGGTPYVPSPVLTDGKLYFTVLNNPSLTCLDFRTGKVINRRRLPGIGSLYASPVEAAGKIYFTGRGGTTVVVDRSNEMKILATNRLDDTIDGSPAVVGKQLFLRGWKHLYCIESKKER